LGYILGVFFKNSSGHPDSQQDDGALAQSQMISTFVLVDFSEKEQLPLDNAS
jgi:hypothetical protein